MKTTTNFGNSCRFGSALFAGAGARLQFVPGKSLFCGRLPKFAQLPPATLFAALARSSRRRTADRQLASGMRLASGSADC
jgi:hypothetical protein